jgi:hypothetical protein
VELRPLLLRELLLFTEEPASLLLLRVETLDDEPLEVELRELLLLTEEPAPLLLLRVETLDDELLEAAVRELLTPVPELRVALLLRDTPELFELLRVIGVLRALSLLPEKEEDSRELLPDADGLDARELFVVLRAPVVALLRFVVLRLLPTLEELEEPARLLEELLFTVVLLEFPLFRKAVLALAERYSALMRPLRVFVEKLRLRGRPLSCGM